MPSNKFSSLSVRALAICLVGILCVPQFIFAATGVPKILNYQGRLMDSSGNLLGGSGTQYCFKFSLYDNASVGSGSKLWPTSAPSTMTAVVKNGIFSVGIGDTGVGGDTLDFNFEDTDTVYLNVDVATKVGATCAPGDGAESFETLGPRPRIYSSGFAINASTLNGFTAGQIFAGAFSTTSADFFATQRNFFSTSSADWWKSQNNFFSTSSADYFLAQNQGAAFSTTSAANFLSTYDKGYFFSTTSTDYWKTANNFFSTTSAEYWKSGSDFFSTSSADYLAEQRNYFSTSSAEYFADSSTTVAKTYTDNTFGGTQTFANASTTNISATYSSSTQGYFGSIFVGTLNGVLRAVAGNVTTGLVDLVSEVSGVLGVTHGGTGWASLASGAVLYGNGTGAVATTTAGLPGQVLAILNGVPTWTSTTTFSGPLNYVNGNVSLDTSGNWTGTLNNYTAAQLISLGFSTTSADYWTGQRNFFATSSADYWKTQNNFFSTSSADFLASQRNFFSTTSSDFWKTQNNFFSTSSADYFITQNQGASFSTTSAIYFAHSSTTIPKTYTNNTFLGTQTFDNVVIAAASSTALFAQLFTGADAFIGDLVSTSSTRLASTTAYGKFITGNVISTSTATSSFNGPLSVNIARPSSIVSIMGSVTAPTSATGTAILTVSNDNNTLSSGNNVMRLNMRTAFGTGCVAGTTCPRFIEFFTGAQAGTDNTGTGVGRIQLSTAGTGITQTSGAADFAEYMSLNSSAEVGDLVSLNSAGQYQKAIAGQSLIGVVSDNPAFVGNGNLEGSANAYIVGFAGVIKTTVSAANGAISAGDFISASSTTAGVGVKLLTSGFALGQALESFSGPDTGTISVLVLPKYIDAAVALESYGGSNGGASGYWSLSTSTGVVSLASSTYSLLIPNTTIIYASSTAISSEYASSTHGYFGSLVVGTLAGVLRASAGTVTTGLVDLATETTGILPVGKGGTGWANLAAGAILYGNGTGAVATTTTGLPGQVLALLNGVPTWTSTTTFSNGLIYSNGNVTLDRTGDWTGTLSGLTAAQIIAQGFSTSSANYYASQTNLSGFSTTSADHWKDQRNFFSTSSADYYKSANNFFSTSSADFLATQRNFFSTSSADFYKSVTSFFSTTSNDYWKTQNNFFSTSSANYYNTQNNSFGGYQNFQNSSTTNASTTNLSATYASSTSGYFGSLFVGALNGVIRAAAGAVTTGLVDLASEVTGVLGVTRGGTGWANVAAGAILFGNGAGSLSTTTAAVPGQMLAYLNGVPTWVSTTTFSGPLLWSGGSVTITNATADDSTKGAATFTAADFNDNGSGLISLDYANGQKASASVAGFLSSGDWSSFNNKVSSTSLSAAYPLQYNSSTGIFNLAYGTTTANTWSQLQTFATGIWALASSTIGNGTQAGGLYISGGATTTGTAYFAGNVGIGTTSPGSVFSIGNVANFTAGTTTIYSTGGIDLAGGCFSVDGECIDARQPATNVTLSAVRTYTSTSTWTKPSNLIYAVVEVWGGGGEGGNCDAAGDACGGGGGGGYALRTFQASFLAGTTSIQAGVGTGGSGSADTATGVSGRQSNFGGYATSTGGVGGSRGIGAAAGVSAPGGAGGSGSGGDTNLSGNAGVSGISHTTTSLHAQGTGGSSPRGGGGGAGATSNAGTATVGNPCGGGGGGGPTPGAGGSGCIVVYEYTANNVSLGQGTVNSGTVGQFAFYNVNGTAVSGTSNLFIDTTTNNIGVGSTTPWAKLSVQADGLTGPAFAVGSSSATYFLINNGGRVGVGTTSPSAQLAVSGSGYFTGNLLTQGVFTGSSYVATSTVASIFPYASTTAITVVNLVSTNATTTSFSATSILSTNATTTSLAVTNIAAGSLLKIGTGGALTAALPGTDYLAGRTDFNFAQITFGTSTAATTTSIWTQGVFFSSSTIAASQFPYASTTALSATNLDVSGMSALGTVTSGTWNGTSVVAAFGGTGLSSYAAGDILYANTPTSLARVASTTSGTVLALVSGIPTWVATTTLSTISGTLAVGNGGTGQTTLSSGQLLYGTGSGAVQSVGTSTVLNGTGISVTGTGAVVGGGLTINFAAPALTALSIPYASTTALSATNASTTNLTVSSGFFESGFGDCSSEVGNVLYNSTTGKFSCGTDSGAAGGAVTSVSAGDSTVVVTPTVGDVEVTLNLANSNIWTGLQRFGNASTTQISAGIGYFGQTSTTTIDGDGSITFGSNSADIILQNGVDQALNFSTSSANVPVLTISTRASMNGLVGIGTTSPWGKFSVEMGTINPAFVVSNNGSSSPALYVGGINQNGLVGIGTSSPWAQFSINPDNIGNAPAFAIGSSSATYFLVNNGGRVGIGSSSPNYALDVNGDVNVASGKCFRVNGVCIGYTVKLAAIYSTSTQSTSGVDNSIVFTGAQGSSPSFSAGTLTLPSNTSHIIVETQGGGGGGGGVSNAGVIKVASGGGQGGYARDVINAPTGTYFYAVGAAGTAGTNAGGNGGTGGSTCVKASATACTGPLVGAAGGSGGTGGVSATIKAGAAGGAGLAGAYQMTGAPGGATVGATANDIQGGYGGGPGGGAAVVATAAGNNGTKGGGGSGAATITAVATANVGGTGGAGVLIVTVYATSSPNAQGNDYAEMFPVSDGAMTPGDIVAVDTGLPISMTYARAGDTKSLAGIVATQPGQILGDANAAGERPIALAGRVPTKVNLENGPIQIGDRIAPSSVPGVGKRAGPFDDSVGIALSTYDGSSSTTTVTVFIDLQFGVSIDAIAFSLLGNDPSIYGFSSSTTSSTQNTPLDFVGGMMSAIAKRLSLFTVNGSQDASTVSTSSPQAASTTPGTVDGFAQGLLQSIFDKLTQILATAGNGISDIFANALHAKEEICVDDQCLSRDDIKAMKAKLIKSQTGSTGSPQAASAGTTQSTSGGGAVIEIQGNNPATIKVGDVYADLGALITAPQADLNLKVDTLVDGLKTDEVTIDTSFPSEHVVTYRVIDAAGYVSEVERTVRVINPTATEASSTPSTAASTLETSASSTPSTLETTETSSNSASSTAPVSEATDSTPSSSSGQASSLAGQAPQAATSTQPTL